MSNKKIIVFKQKIQKSKVFSQFVPVVKKEKITASTPEKKINKITSSFHKRNERTFDENFSSTNLQKNDFNNGTTENNPLLSQEMERRRNEVGIEMLPKSLYTQIFGKDKGVNVAPEQVMRARKHLLEHGLLDKKTDSLPNVDFALPLLEGDNIEEHFYNIAEAQCATYRQLISSILIKNLPKMPTQWLQQAGWTKYEPDRQPCHVPFPSEHALVFDVEECVQGNRGPTLATAVSATAWYSWVSDALAEVINSGKETHIDIDSKNIHSADLINLESKRFQTPDDAEKLKLPKIIIGHNVAYDRARIKEQYWLQCSATRFLDTMSLHVAVSGISSYQKVQLSAKKSKQKNENILEDILADITSLNNLSDVHKLYCGGKGLEKSSRNLFITGTLKQIAENFNELVTYCANDVIATHEVLVSLFPMFLERFPHPVTLAGMLELSVSYLPVDQSWLTYIRNAQEKHNDLETEATYLLAKKANEACRLLHGNAYKNDPWLWDQDWSTKDLILKKSITNSSKLSIDWDKEDCSDPMAKKFCYLAKQKALLPKSRPHLPGYPAWYRKLCPTFDIGTINEEATIWRPGPLLITSGMSITPKLLQLTWDGYPLQKINKHGWGFVIPGRPIFGNEEPSAVPIESIKKMCLQCQTDHIDLEINLNTLSDDVEQNISKTDFHKQLTRQDTYQPIWYKGTGILCPEVNIPGCWFRKLPHPSGNETNVGNPLSRDFVTRLSEGTLQGAEAATALLAIKNSLSYWQHNRDRIESQHLVWLENETLPDVVRDALQKENADFVKCGAIIPLLIVCGTLTRRAVEKTWLTASNAVPQRVGSELRAMIRAPPGYHLVGADVDSQELWLAALMADASYAGIHGATAFGWRTLEGKKSDGTDLHSATAKSANTSRDNAKVLNYARIYGAGVQFAQNFFKRICPKMTDEESLRVATNTINQTKGKKLLYLPASAINTLIELELCNSSSPEDSKAFIAPWGDFGTLAEDGGVFLTYKEMHNLQIQESISGLDLKTSPSSQIRKIWYGGTESAMFNKIEEIANSQTPCTPFLQARLSRALEPSAVGTKNYLTTRVNWVVQSSAVDFLHLMLVCMRWLLGNHTNWRFVISFHDEVRYMVPSEMRYDAAVALHATNLLARAFCARRVGIHDLPHSVAFFSAVEVDLAMRKDANNDYCTSSNPHGLLRGYGIPKGETLDISLALKKAGSKCLISLMRKNEQ